MYLMQNFFQSPDTYGVNIVASMIFADRDDAYAEMHKQAEDALTNYYNDENYNDENIELEDDGDQVHVVGSNFSDSWVVSEIADEPIPSRSKSVSAPASEPKKPLSEMAWACDGDDSWTVSDAKDNPVQKHSFGLIPEGCKYSFFKAKTTIVGDGKSVYFPEKMQSGDYYIDKCYRYTYRDATGLSAKVLQRNLTSYGHFLESLCGEPLKSIDGAFYGCKKMRIAPTIPGTVTSMNCAFVGCKDLVMPPEIPSGVTDMEYAFYACDSLVMAPRIPEGVSSLCYTFNHCKSLYTYEGSDAPDGDFSGYHLPSKVEDMKGAFTHCDKMKVAPVIPDAVENMYMAFMFCKSLKKAPALPASARCIADMFRKCTALEEAPVIHSGVTSMDSAFAGCSKLQEICCDADLDIYSDALKGTKITEVTGKCSQETKDKLLDTVNMPKKWSV